MTNQEETRAMTYHMAGTREEELAARPALLEAEKAHLLVYHVMFGPTTAAVSMPRGDAGRDL